MTLAAMAAGLVVFLSLLLAALVLALSWGLRAAWARPGPWQPLLFSSRDVLDELRAENAH